MYVFTTRLQNRSPGHCCGLHALLLTGGAVGLWDACTTYWDVWHAVHASHSPGMSNHR
jgi:hypothetical protein